VVVETSFYGEAQGPARHHQERQRDVPHLLQVKLAYKELKEVDGLDISKEGVEAWEFAMKRYNKCIDRGGILRVWRPLLTARIRDYKEHLCQERQGQPVGLAPASPSHLSNLPSNLPFNLPSPNLHSNLLGLHEELLPNPSSPPPLQQLQDSISS